MQKNNSVKNEKNEIVKNDKKSHTDYLREAVRKYIDENDLTLAEFAEKADLPTNTLQSMIYKETGCRLETAIAISKAIGIGLDELANTGSLPDETILSIQKTRSLPEYRRLLIRRYINWQYVLEGSNRDGKKKIIDVMNLDYVNDHLFPTDDIEPYDISDMDDDIKAKVYRGMRIPCQEYIQFYRENDVLLLCDDRQPRSRERCVVLYYGRIFIVQMERRNGIIGYRGIRNAEVFVTQEEVDYYFGYVAGVKHE